MVLAVTVEVYEPNGTTLITDVPRRKEVTWQDELNGVGMGSFKVHTLDPILQKYPNLLNHGNIVKFRYEGSLRYAFRIEQRNTQVIDDNEVEAQWRSVQGRGLLSMLQDAVVYPEYGLRSTSGDKRLFGFASKHGTWYDSAHWTQPQAILPAQDTTFRGTKPPEGWPDELSKWTTADRSPNADAPPGTIQWFRATYNATTAGNLKFFVVADNFFTLYVNGEPVMTTEDQPQNSYLWREVKDVLVPVNTGPVTVAIRVTNGGTRTAGNPVAFMLSAWTVNSNGDHVLPILRTDGGVGADDDFKGYTGPPPPGFRASDILLTLMEEAQTRGVDGIEYLQPAFNASTDSTGLATFTDRQDLEARIGFENILDIVTKLTETSFDVAVMPNMQVHAWVVRGTDRSTGPNPVKLEYGYSLVDHRAQSNAPTATRLIVRASDGSWQEVVHAAGETASGRKEAGLSLGNNQRGTAVAIAQEALKDTAVPKLSVESAGIPARDNLKPYVHFGVGDIVLTLDEDGVTYIPVHVVALSISEDEGGNIFVDPELSRNLTGRKAPKTIEQRAQQWTKSIMEGTLGGAVANAAPVPLGSSMEQASTAAGGGGGPGGYVPPARESVTLSTGLLAAGEALKDRILMATRFRILSIKTDVPARVRLYSRIFDRDTDLGRPILYDPPPHIGIVMDYLTADGFLEAPLSPEPEGSTFAENDPASPGSNEVPITVTSINGGPVTVTLTYLPLE